MAKPMLGLNYKRILKKTTILGLTSMVVFLIFGFTRAHALDVGINEVQNEIQLSSTDPRIIIARVINVALSLLGVVALIIVILGGFSWMMSGGDEAKIKKAKAFIIQGVIGMVIVLSAWAIARFVLNSLLDAISGTGRFSGTTSTVVLRSGSLGRGIIDMHYPARGQNDVPRNTNIMITFKQAIKLSSIIEGYDDANTPANFSDDTVSGTRVTVDGSGYVTVPDLNLRTDALKIYTASSGRGSALASNRVKVRFMPNRLTFVFDPVDYLGSASEDVLYTVELPGGTGGLRLDSGSAAFSGAYSGGYIWQFTTSTIIDVTPPQVSDCYPVCRLPGAPELVPPPDPYAKNVLIQVNFNESIDPTSITANNIKVTNPLPSSLVSEEDVSIVAGEWLIANNYQTIEFRPNEACGTNSCGETIYCLPGPTRVGVRLKAASVFAPTDTGYDPDQPAKSTFPYSGIADAAANSLNDQGSNAVSDGPPTDNVNFNFETSGSVDLSAPQIEFISPRGTTDIPAGNIAQDALVSATFNKVMSRSSLNTSSLRIDPNPDHELWYTPISTNLDASGAPVAAGGTPVKTKVDLDHASFIRSSAKTCSVTSTRSCGSTSDCPAGESCVLRGSQGYVPRILSQVSASPFVSGVRDAYQNCFVPVSGPGRGADGACSGVSGNPYCCNGTEKNNASCGGLD